MRTGSGERRRPDLLRGYGQQIVRQLVRAARRLLTDGATAFRVVYNASRVYCRSAEWIELTFLPDPLPYAKIDNRFIYMKFGFSIPQHGVDAVAIADGIGNRPLSFVGLLVRDSHTFQCHRKRCCAFFSFRNAK